MKIELRIFTAEEIKKVMDALGNEKVTKFVADIKNISEEQKDQYGRFRMMITTEDLDRQGEIIKLDAWRFENYLKNPIVLWAHDYMGLPIAVTEAIEKDEGKKGYFAVGFFAPEEANPQAQLVRRLHDLGILRTSSVGFIPTKRDSNNENIITEAELLEWSFVPVPANPMAVSLLGANNALSYVTKGVLKKEEVCGQFEKSLETENCRNCGKAEVEHKPEPETEGEFIIIRVKDPDYFDPDSFRTINVSEEQGIKATVGCKKGEYSGGKCGIGVEVQRYLFDKEKWTESEAQAWVDEHKGLSIETITAIGDIMKGKDVDRLLEAVSARMNEARQGTDEAIVKTLSALMDDVRAIYGEEGEGKGMKVGRVLSEKNRAMIKGARDHLAGLVEELQKAIGVFDELLVATEPPEKGDDGDGNDIKNAKSAGYKNVEEWIKDDQKFLKMLSTMLNDKLRVNREKLVKGELIN